MTSAIRKDLTYAHNQNLDRHGVLRLTPAYSVKIVQALIQGQHRRGHLLDPYSGTGTTPIVGGQNGMISYSVDINPFLVWLGNAKARNYTQDHLHRAIDLAEDIVLNFDPSDSSSLESAPPIFNIQRWWSEIAIKSLVHIRDSIEGSNECDSIKDVMKISFCRTIISSSNASFNHQSMSFKSADASEESVPNDRFVREFLEDVKYTANSFLREIEIPPLIMLGDSRDIGNLPLENIGLVITSPPYPNRMSYIRELRPYMYWLGFLSKSSDAAELDWAAIGGTWGSATSKVGKWTPQEDYYIPATLIQTLADVEGTDKENSRLLANYIRKYFYDMWLHINNLYPLLNRDAKINYIVGNSKYYETMLHVEEIFADMFREVGLRDVKIDMIRKRNSKKELYEFNVSARV